MIKKLLLIFMVLLVGIDFSACKKATEEKKVPKVGPVKITLHPSTLEGKTVVLRWNGKFNGDNFLNRVAELFTKQVKDIKVIKMWEVDPSTAAISDSLGKSKELMEKIAKFKPHLIIAAQAD
jgi:hypothetical protein